AAHEPMTKRLPSAAWLTAILVAVLALAAGSVSAMPTAGPAPESASGSASGSASESGSTRPPGSPADPGEPGTAGPDGAGDPCYPTEGKGGYDVTGSAVPISYAPPSRHLDGDTTITAVALQSLSRFNLDLSGLDVRSVEVDGAAATFAMAGEHELVITPPATVRRGSTFRVRVRYDGQPQRLN